MTQFTTNAIIYGIFALLIVLLLLRLLRRKQREWQASQGLQPAPRMNAEQTGATGRPEAAISQNRAAGGPEAAASQPGLVSAAAIDAPLGGTAAPLAPKTGVAAGVPEYHAQWRGAASAAGTVVQPALFKTLGKKVKTSDDELPLIEADETPLASADDLVFGPLTPALAALLPDSEMRRAQVKQELKNAGLYQPNALQNLAAIRYVCIMVPILALGALLVIAPPAAEKFIIGALVFLPLCGWALPRLYVKSKAADRTSQIERAMPDMLDMLNMCVSQGMTVTSALKRVSQDLPNVHPALYKELQIVTEQAQIGTLQHALENFNKRIDVPEVHSFTSLLIQTEQMGTSVSSALADYSDNMRTSLRQRADEKGNQAAFKLLFPTVLCLMPAVYMFLLGPSIIELSNFFQRDSLNLQQANQIIQRTGQTPNRGR